MSISSRPTNLFLFHQLDSVEQLIFLGDFDTFSMTVAVFAQDARLGLNDQEFLALFEAEGPKPPTIQSSRHSLSWTIERQHLSESARKRSDELEHRWRSTANFLLKTEARAIALEFFHKRKHAGGHVSEVANPENQRPPKQPYGVSSTGAAQLCADWLKHLGATNVNVSEASGKSGIDILAKPYVAQVIHHPKKISESQVQVLAGVTSAEKAKPMFFTSSSYSPEAVAFADRVEMPAFVFSPEEGTLVGANGFARDLLLRGFPTSVTKTPPSTATRPVRRRLPRPDSESKSGQ